MTIKDIYETTEANAKVTLRIFEEVSVEKTTYIDVTATYETIEKYSDLSIMCIVPYDGELLVELA